MLCTTSVVGQVLMLDLTQMMSLQGVVDKKKFIAVIH